MNHLGTTIVVPLTSRARRAGYATTPIILRGEGGVAEDSVVLCHHVRVLDCEKLVRKMGDLSAERMSALEMALAFALGLPA